MLKSAFLARQSVDAGLRRIAIYEAVAKESSIPRILEDGVYSAEHPRIGRRHKKDQRHDKERRISRIHLARSVGSARLSERDRIYEEVMAPFRGRGLGCAAEGRLHQHSHKRAELKG